jgi:hypothetical protein
MMRPSPGTLTIAVALVVVVGCKKKANDEQRQQRQQQNEPMIDAAVADASPWQGLGLEARATPEPGETVWAAARASGQWSIDRFKIDGKIGDDTLAVSRARKRIAPSAFVQPLTTEIPAKGTPVLFVSSRPEYGVVIGEKAGRPVVQSLSLGQSTKNLPMSADELLPVSGDTFRFGGPAIFKDEKDEEHYGIVVGRSADKIQVLVGLADAGTLRAVDPDKVQLIDHDEPLAKKQRVWFLKPTSGSLDSGTILSTFGKVGYAVRGDNGNLYRVVWAHVAPIAD